MKISPLWSVGSHTIAVEEMHRRVGGLVAQDLVQKLGPPIDKPGRQGDFGATGTVTPERALES